MALPPAEIQPLLRRLDALIHQSLPDIEINGLEYLYGDYYHIDVAMSVVYGIEAAFLKTDAQFEEMLYTWDRENTVSCDGELTLEDIIGAEDPDDTDDSNNRVLTVNHRSSVGTY